MIEDFRKLLTTISDSNEKGTEIKRSDENDRYPHIHKGSLWEFLSKNYLRQISILDTYE